MLVSHHRHAGVALTCDTRAAAAGRARIVADDISANIKHKLTKDQKKVKKMRGVGDEWRDGAVCWWCAVGDA